jgi:integrase/recombinase XerD
MEHSSKRADYRHIGRRALFAILVYAGLRISEACRLRWRDVDLARGILKVGVLSGDGKTVASVRIVNIVPALRDELAAWKATTRYGSVKDYVITTAVGTPRDKDNARQRVVDPVLGRINELRAQADRDPFPDFTTHTGRRTFATHLIAIGEMPDYVQDQLGHEDPTLAMRVYRQRRSVRAAPDPRLFKLYGRPHHLPASATQDPPA